MKVLLQASTLADLSNGANCFLFELTEELLNELLAQRETFQMALSNHKSLNKLTVWGIPGSFYDVDWDELLARLGDDAGAFEASEYLRVPEAFTVDDLVVTEGEEKEVSTEIEETVVTQGGVYFHAGLKYSSAYVESRVIPFDVLLSWKEELAAAQE